MSLENTIAHFSRPRHDPISAWIRPAAARAPRVPGRCDGAGAGSARGATGGTPAPARGAKSIVRLDPYICGDHEKKHLPFFAFSFGFAVCCSRPARATAQNAEFTPGVGGGQTADTPLKSTVDCTRTRISWGAGQPDGCIASARYGTVHQMQPILP